jgi:hypothetical protein
MTHEAIMADVGIGAADVAACRATRSNSISLHAMKWSSGAKIGPSEPAPQDAWPPGGWATDDRRTADRPTSAYMLVRSPTAELPPIPLAR